jgi:hypothetical protein
VYSGPYTVVRKAYADDAMGGIFWARKVERLQKRFVYGIDLIDL